MPYAINIRSDDPSSDLIRALWEQCSVLEARPSQLALNYAPHITFTIYEDVALKLLSQALDAAFESLPALRVRFSRLGYFVADGTVILWAAPEFTHPIADIHERIHRIMGLDLCRPNYRPGVWVPHCSLATAIPESNKAKAIELASKPINPIAVVFDVADCVTFFPVEVLYERRLRTAA